MSLTSSMAQPRRRRLWTLALSLTLGIRTMAGLAAQQTAPTRPPVPGAPAGVTAFVDVGVVPMDTDRVLEHQTVLIQGGRVTALGPADATTVPASAARIDGHGKYLMPGMGTCHGHMHGDSPRTDLELFAELAHGIMVHRNASYFDYTKTPGSENSGEAIDGPNFLRLRAQAAAGQAWSPRLVLAGQWGPIQYVTSAQPGRIPDEPLRSVALRLDSIPAYLAAYKAEGYDFVKLRNETPEIADSVRADARRIGLQVGGHVALYVGINSAEFQDPTIALARGLAGGQTVLDHWYMGVPKPDAVADWQTAAAAALGATRRAGAWICWGAAWDDTPFSDIVGPVLRIATDSGVGLLLGDDGAAGIGVLRLMVSEGGITPYQALATATKNYGQYLRTLDPEHGAETGTIAVGQRADLLLLTGNPLADIRYAAPVTSEESYADYESGQADSNPAVVMIGGRWLTRAELNRRTAVYKSWRRLRASLDGWVAGGSTGSLAADTTLPAGVRQAMAQLDSVHRRQQDVLLQRFVLASKAPAGGADSLRGPQRMVELFARQLGEVRAVLTAAARDSFDTNARAWLAQRAAAGYHIAIPGVSP